MKHLPTLFFVLLSSGTILSSCRKKSDTPPMYTREGYVIGFDPCSAKSSSKGLVLAFPVSSEADTVVTYTLPESTYDLPPELFEQYRTEFLFPPAYQTKYKVRVTYSFTPEAEKNYAMCTSDINLSPFNYTVKNRQITVKSAQPIQ